MVPMIFSGWCTLICPLRTLESLTRFVYAFVVVVVVVVVVFVLFVVIGA